MACGVGENTGVARTSARIFSVRSARVLDAHTVSRIDDLLPWAYAATPQLAHVA